MTDSNFEAWLDELVNQTIDNWATMNSRLPARQDLIEHCLRLGAEAAWAKAQDEINKTVLEKLKFYVTPQLMAHEDAERYKQQAAKLAEALERIEARARYDEGCEFEHIIDEANQALKAHGHKEQAE